MSTVNEPIIKELTVTMRTTSPTTDTEVYTVKVGSACLPKGFYEMKPHVQRVWVESMELGARIVNLEGFLKQEELVAEHCSDEMVSTFCANAGAAMVRTAADVAARSISFFISSLLV